MGAFIPIACLHIVALAIAPKPRRWRALRLPQSATYAPLSGRPESGTQPSLSAVVPPQRGSRLLSAPVGQRLPDHDIEVSTPPPRPSKRAKYGVALPFPIRLSDPLVAWMPRSDDTWRRWRCTRRPTPAASRSGGAVQAGHRPIHRHGPDRARSIVPQICPLIRGDPAHYSEAVMQARTRVDTIWCPSELASTMD